MTRLLLTRIPFFKEIIVSSFSCDSCSWSNTEIQSAGRIQEQGVRYTLAVTSRQVGRAPPLLRPQICTFPRERGLGPTPLRDPSVWEPLDLLGILRLLLALCAGHEQGGGEDRLCLSSDSRAGL